MQKIFLEEEQAFKKRKKNQYYRIFGIVTVCMIIFFILYRIDGVRNIVNWFLNVLSPIIWGVALAYLLNPILNFFEKHFTKFFTKRIRSERRQKKLIKIFSLTLTVSFGIVLVTALLLAVIPEFLRRIQELIDIIPHQLTNLFNWLDVQTNSDNTFMKNFGDILRSVVDYFNNWLVNNLNTSISNILSIATNSIVAVIGFIMNFFISIVVAVYALSEKKHFIGQSKKLLFAIFSPERANDILHTARHGHKIFGNYLSGKIIDSLMVGVVCFIVMTILGIPYSLLVSVIIGCTNIIPFFGPFIGGVPSLLIILLTDVNKGIIFIIMIFILQIIEGNIIEPRVIGITTGISEFWITFSLLLFGGMFGIVGMIIAVPLFGVLYYIVRMIVNRWLQRKNLPVSSDDYYKVESLDANGFVFFSEEQALDKKSSNKRFFSFLKRDGKGKSK